MACSVDFNMLGEPDDRQCNLTAAVLLPNTLGTYDSQLETKILELSDPNESLSEVLQRVQQHTAQPLMDGFVLQVQNQTLDVMREPSEERTSSRVLEKSSGYGGRHRVRACDRCLRAAPQTSTTNLFSDGADNPPGIEEGLRG